MISAVALASIQLSVNQTTDQFEVAGLTGTAKTLGEACYNLVQYNMLLFVAPAGGINLSVTNPNSGPTINLPVTMTGPIEAGIQYDPASNTNQWSESFCCLHANSLVQTSHGDIPIHQLQSGDRVLDYRGLPLPIHKVVKFCIPSRQFVKLSENSLGENSPSKDLLIVGNHPILVDGYSVESSQLVNHHSITEVDLGKKPAPVYTVITTNPTWFRVQGVNVATWSAAAWEREVKQRHLLVQYQ